MNEIKENLKIIKEKIAFHAQKAGRNPDEILLVGVSKKHPATKIREAYKAGLKDIGENYVQEALAKMKELKDLDINWHFIGRLQRNKAKYVVGKFILIHGVDSEKVLLTLNNQCEKRCGGNKQAILLEINIGGEETKGGISPSEAEILTKIAMELPYIQMQGFMTIPPPLEPEKVRPYFRKMRELKEEIEAKLGVQLPHLSMGMSADFGVAIEEGATIVRIGTAIFGPRPQ